MGSSRSRPVVGAGRTRQTAHMRAVVQRVERASVSVEAEVVGKIECGLCVLVGVTHDDNELHAVKLADKVWKLRVFEDGAGKMNLSLGDVGGQVLVVSQFSLYGDARKGNRPSFMSAARPEQAEPLIERMQERLIELGARVETGRFRTEMSVEIVNDGPVTIILDV